MESTPVLDTLANLISINSVNPSYEGGVSEAEVANFVERFFQDRGIETSRQNVLHDRDNVIAKVRGSDPGRRIVLEAHMDTVAACDMIVPPFTPETRDGRMYGRGACDTKAGLAAMMHATASLVERSITPPCDVWFAATVDEEYRYRGVTALCNSLKAEGQRTDAAIIAEPTMLKPVVASKGLVRFTLETIGKAAHSAKPELGVNAIEQMARVITAIADDTRRLSQSSHPLLGPATCNIGTIGGGVQINLVPASCEIEIDRRMLPGETVEGVLEHFRELIASIPDVNVRIHPPMLTDVPLQTSVESEPVQCIATILREMDLDPNPVGVPFCSDASKFGAIGIPSMILGPGNIDQAHTADEYVECAQVLVAEKVFGRFIAEFRRGAETPQADPG